MTTEIVGFNHDDLTSGGKAAYSFAAKNVMNDPRPIYTPLSSSVIFVESDIYEWLSGNLYSSLQEDLKQIVKQVNKRTRTSATNYNIRTDIMKLFLLSTKELNFGTYAYDEGNPYPAFTSDLSRKKTTQSGFGVIYWTRTPVEGGSENMYACVNEQGKWNSSKVSSEQYVCFGFCV